MSNKAVIYHNPRCSKSRNALNLLEERNTETDIVKYLETPPSHTELKDILNLLGMSARELLRKGETEYKELGLADPALSEDEIIDAMVNNPKLIERPIVIVSGKAVVGRPPERVLDLL